MAYLDVCIHYHLIEFKHTKGSNTYDNLIFINYAFVALVATSPLFWEANTHSSFCHVCVVFTKRMFFEFTYTGVVVDVGTQYNDALCEPVWCNILRKR